MLLSTMSYMEIHREIVNDFRDLYSAIMKEYTGFQKTAKKAKQAAEKEAKIKALEEKRAKKLAEIEKLKNSKKD